MKTSTARLAIKVANCMKKLRDVQYEIEHLIFFTFWLFVGYCVAQLLFCIGVMISNEIAK